MWDDCSTDNSANIIGEYQDRRIRYFLSPEDTPLGKARDSAIHQASGDWLAFLDQDDIWLPRKLEKQLALAEAGVGIIYGRTVMFDSRHGNRRDYDYAHEFAPLPEGDIFASLFRRGLLHCHEFCCAAAIRSRGSGGNSRHHSGRPGLLPLRGDCAPLSGEGSARSGLPLSCPWRQHVANEPRAASPGTAFHRRSVG